MTFQAVRAEIESKVYSAFQALSPPVAVVFDNTLETPPALPHVVCLISYTSTTETVICQSEAAIETCKATCSFRFMPHAGAG